MFNISNEFEIKYVFNFHFICIQFSFMFKRLIIHETLCINQSVFTSTNCT